MSDEHLDTTDEALPTSYSSSTPAPATNRKAITAPGGGVGRRKEAVARVRLVPGSGRWVVNGKPLEVYFPNKVHQQSVAIYGYGGIAYIWCATIILKDPIIAKLIANCACHDVVKISYNPL